MRGRSKRIKRSVGRVSNSSGGSGICSDRVSSSARVDTELEDGNPIALETSHFESGSFASRCSIRLINEVVSKFDIQKRQLVNDIGFSGILSFPRFKNFNRKFVLWLMTSVDERSSTLNIENHISIRFTKDDVANIFGIPSVGLSVFEEWISSREAKEYVLQKYLGPEFKEHRSVKFVQDILERDYDSPMAKIDVDRWKVAFVMFVSSNLLCPSTKHDYACIDYWNAIQFPDKIASFDWSEYVRDRLVDAVAKLKQDIASNVKFPNITGCALFLQVLYLDSLDLGPLTLPHSSFPRVMDFSTDKLRAMIMADRNFGRHVLCKQSEPTTKLRDPSGCIYSWAINANVGQSDSHTSCLLAIWVSAVAMVHLLDIPLEAAGLLFVAAADFQEQINSGLTVTGMQAIKFMSVLVSIMIPYRRGFSYHPYYLPSSPDREFIQAALFKGTSLLSVPLSLNCRIGTIHRQGGCIENNNNSDLNKDIRYSKQNQVSASTGCSAAVCSTPFGDSVQETYSSVAATLDALPHQLNVDLRVASAMSQFHAMMRRLKSPLSFDLNDPSGSALLDVPSSSRPCNMEFDDIPSPWDLGFMWPSIEMKCTLDFGKLLEGGGSECLAIVHRCPRLIEVSVGSLASQFLGNREFGCDLVDALLRSLRQQEDSLYSSLGCQRWRHFFESDFMEFILSGAFDCTSASLQQIVSQSTGALELSACKYIFFPALLQCRRVCFVWSPAARVLSVFEPSFCLPVPEERLHVIHRSCFLLKLGLQSLGTCFNVGSNVMMSFVETRIITLSRRPSKWMNRSGLLCSLFCRCFDGSDLIPKSDEVDCEMIACSLFLELRCLKDNFGSFPQLSS